MCRINKWVVVYFFPGDFTPGYTAQADAFADTMNKLAARGVEVGGGGGDSVESHQLLEKAQQLNFTLLADEDSALAREFGVPVGPGGIAKAKLADGNTLEIKRAGTASRWTFIIGKDGKVAYKNARVIPADDAKNVSSFIDRMGKRNGGTCAGKGH